MAKNILNMIIWHPEMETKKCRITYVHRGMPGNLKTIEGILIDKLEQGFLMLKDGAQIPYHRIVRIEYKNEIIYGK